MAKVMVELNERGQLSVEGDKGMPDMCIIALLELGGEVMRRKVIPVALGNRIEVPKVEVPVMREGTEGMAGDKEDAGAVVRRSVCEAIWTFQNMVAEHAITAHHGDSSEELSQREKVLLARRELRAAIVAAVRQN